jgi:hypothetical protein
MLEALVILAATTLFGSGLFLGYRAGCKKRVSPDISDASVKCSPQLVSPPSREIPALPAADGGVGPYRRRSNERTAIVPAEDESWWQRRTRIRKARNENRRILKEVAKIWNIEVEAIKERRLVLVEAMDIDYLIDLLFSGNSSDWFMAERVIKHRKNNADHGALLNALKQPRPRLENLRVIWTGLRSHDSTISGLIECAEAREFFDRDFVLAVAEIGHHDFSWTSYMNKAYRSFPDAFRLAGLDDF